MAITVNSGGAAASNGAVSSIATASFNSVNGGRIIVIVVLLDNTKSVASVADTATADFAPHNMTSGSAPTPFVASASSFYSGLDPYKAFDGGVGLSQYWIGTGGGVDWLQLDIGSGNSKVLYSYGVKVNTIPEPLRAPKNFTLKRSNDGSTWTTLDTQTNQTSWASGELRTFTLGSTPSAYRYFRLDITANNGDATYTQVAELYLNSTAPSYSLVAALNVSSTLRLEYWRSEALPPRPAALSRRTSPAPWQQPSQRSSTPVTSEFCRAMRT